MSRHHQYARVLADGGHAPGVEHVARSDILTPADRYQELFEAVQSRRIFPDSKTFVDCVPKLDPQDILVRYRARKDELGFDLAAFVEAHFDRETAPVSDYVSKRGQPIGAHIDGLWDVLTRRPVEHPKRRRRRGWLQAVRRRRRH